MSGSPPEEKGLFGLEKTVGYLVLAAIIVFALLFVVYGVPMIPGLDGVQRVFPWTVLNPAKFSAMGGLGYY